MSRGAVALERARPAQAAAPSVPQSALTEAARPVRVALSLAARPVLRTTVVTTRLPVRATPTVRVAGCLPHVRSRKARASSPTRLTVRVSRSWVRGSAQPAYQTEAVWKLAAAWSASRDISTSWTAVDSTVRLAALAGALPCLPPLPTFVRTVRVADPSQVRARAVTLSGSAKRSRWQGASRPLPDRLSVVAVSDQSRPAPKRVIWVGGEQRRLVDDRLARRARPAPGRGP